MNFSLNNNCLAVTASQQVLIHDLSHTEEIDEANVQNSGFTKAAPGVTDVTQLAQYNDLLFAGTRRGSVHVINLNTMNVERELKLHNENSWIWGLYAANGRLYSSSQDSDVVMTDIHDNYKVLKRRSFKEQGKIDFMIHSKLFPEYLLVSAGSYLEMTNMRNLDKHVALESCSSSIYFLVTHHPDLIISGNSDGSVTKWSGTTGKILQQTKRITSDVSALCIVGSKYLLVGSSASISVLDFNSLEKIANLSMHSGYVYSIVQSPYHYPGMKIPIISAGGSHVYAWDLEEALASNDSKVKEKSVFLSAGRAVTCLIILNEDFLTRKSIVYFYQMLKQALPNRRYTDLTIKTQE